MDSFPAFVPLEQKRVVVVGGGREGDEKAALFAGAPCELVRLAANEQALRPDTYAGATLVFIGDCDDGFAEAARAAARVAGAMLVNCIDRPALCDFYTPSIVDRGCVVGAVGTTGNAPGLARRLRREIDQRWPKGLHELATLVARMKPRARTAYPDFDARRTYLDRLLDSESAELALAGRLEEAMALAIRSNAVFADVDGLDPARDPERPGADAPPHA